MSKYMFNSSTSSAITGTRFNNASQLAEKTILSDFNLIASKQPITSVGIIAFTVNKQTREIKYLMIQRKHSVGFVDFVRGKYVLHNKMQILSLLSVMTESEHLRLVTEDFGSLWREMWGGHEDSMAREKLEHLRNGVMTNYNFYTLGDCIKEVASESLKWTHNDWGFPKGRKNFNETDLNCATREFTEETGIDQSVLSIITNIVPYEEIFTGSNFKSYKHKYYLAYIEQGETSVNLGGFQREEVGNIGWKTLSEALNGIREYHVERKELLRNVDVVIRNLKLFN
jgi:ADP-ribose pyrophosphatase YjhB (NUDIX family)